MLFSFACEAAGASRARHSLRPLIFWANSFAQLGRIAPRDRGVSRPEHDPEKWIPVFRKDHAQTKK
jgi:hypothetical protein